MSGDLRAAVEGLAREWGDSANPLFVKAIMRVIEEHEPRGAVLVTEETLAAVLSRGVTFDYGGRLQLALWWPDATDHPIVSAEMGYWLRAAAAILAKLREGT